MGDGSGEGSVDLDLRGRLQLEGEIVTQDESCRAAVRVVVERRSATGWVEVGSATTDADGAFALSLKDRSGRYRAAAAEVRSAERTCLEAVSTTVRHRH